MTKALAIVTTLCLCAQATPLRAQATPPAAQGRGAPPQPPQPNPAAPLYRYVGEQYRIYTIDDACTGTIAFGDRFGTRFDIVTSPAGHEIWMIQTNPNTVFQGTATRTLRAHDPDRQ